MVPWLLFVTISASAHHSVAAFDRDHPQTLSGIVRQFRYTNPHTWIYLLVPDGKGGDSHWDMEGGAVSRLVREGWTRDTLKPGMKIKLLIAPRRNGADGGEWLQLLEIDGRPFPASSR
jgi:Family of unknown function (DUF6152)